MKYPTLLVSVLLGSPIPTFYSIFDFLFILVLLFFEVFLKSPKGKHIGR